MSNTFVATLQTTLIRTWLLRSDHFYEPRDYQPPLIKPNGAIYFRNYRYGIVTDLDLTMKKNRFGQWQDLRKQISEHHHEIAAMPLTMEFFVIENGTRFETQFIDHQSQHASEPNQTLAAFQQAGYDVYRNVGSTAESMMHRSRLAFF